MSPSERASASIDHAKGVVGALLFNWAKRVVWAGSWTPPSALSAAVFSKTASPFLWHLLGLLAARDAPPSRAEIRMALALTADCLMGQLTAGVHRIPEGEPARIVLPYCAQVLYLGCSATHLLPASPSRLAVAGGDSRLEDDKDAVRVVDRSTPSVRLFTVAASQDPVSFDEFSRSQMVSHPARQTLEAFGTRLGEALELVRMADPELHRSISRDVRYFSLIQGTEREHRSFSLSTLQGVVFLSDSPWRTPLAEAIVHEHAHGELYTLCDLDPLVRPQADRLFYSPWRTDPRPLIGLFHALYVFENVACFLGQLPQNGENVDIDLEERIGFIDLQLGVALAQVDPADLTPCGLGILEMIIDSMKERGVSRRFGDHGSGGMKRLLAHARAWSRNPGSQRSVDVGPLLLTASEILRSGSHLHSRC